MCTVIISVPADSGAPVRLIAVRDEDPARPWDRLGAWWPEAFPDVVGIRDARAGGAWLAAAPEQRRLAVLLNRHDLSDRPDDAVQTRGSVALESAAGRGPARQPPMRGFNLVEVTAHTARVVSWDGLSLSNVELSPGTHMIAHDAVDDPATARITRWLPEFREAASSFGNDAQWWRGWMPILERSAELPGDDPAAIIRRQSFEGIASYSLVLCVATVGKDGLEVLDAPLSTPGEWTPAPLRQQPGRPDVSSAFRAAPRREQDAGNGKEPTMSDPTPHTRHSDDARADDAPPTDAVTDDVREEAARAESGRSAEPPVGDTPAQS